MKCAEIVKTVSMSGFGGNGAGCGADEEPFCGAADVAPGAAAPGYAQSVVAFVGERGGFLAFIGEVVTMGDGREIWLGSSRTIWAGVTVARFSAAMVARVCAS